MKINSLNNFPSAHRTHIARKAENVSLSKRIEIVLAILLAFCLTSIVVVAVLMSTSLPGWLSVIAWPLMIINVIAGLVCTYFEVVIYNKKIKKAAYQMGIYPLKCWDCGYLIHNPTSRYCPECGAPLVGENTVQE